MIKYELTPYRPKIDRNYVARKKRELNKITKLCRQCYGEFQTSNNHKYFCSEKCRKHSRNKTYISINDLREFVFERDNFTCNVCKIKATNIKQLNAHHIIPIYKGGPDTVDNIETLCEKCHKEKHRIWD